MAIFNQSDMFYKDYSWTTVKGDDPKVSGEPDSTMFSRKEGYEVIYLINKCLTKWDFKFESSGQKLEKMIRNYLPSETRSQQNVYNWLSANWNNYYK